MPKSSTTLSSLAKSWQRGFDRIYFVSCGAPNRIMLGLQYWLERYSHSLEVRRYFPADFMDIDPPRLDEHTLVVLASKSGTPQETIAAARFLQGKPCLTVGVTQTAELPLAQAVQHCFLLGRTDEAYFDCFMILQALIGGILAKREGWPLLDKLNRSLKALPQALTSAVIGLCTAIPLALIRTYGSPWLALPIRLYTLVFRGTPLFVQLLIIYSGLASLSFIRESSSLWWFFRDGMHCVILALALNTCAYTIEILAGVLRTPPRGEIEAALALGMTRSQLFIHVLIPSMLRRALPAYSNEVIFVLHATAIAFTATVPDILKIAVDVNAATFKTFQAYGIAALLYILVACALVGVFRLTERRLLAYQRFN